jgi:hypothetical protein
MFCIDTTTTSFFSANGCLFSIVLPSYSNVALYKGGGSRRSKAGNTGGNRRVIGTAETVETEGTGGAEVGMGAFDVN